VSGLRAWAARERQQMYKLALVPFLTIGERWRLSRASWDLATTMPNARVCPFRAGSCDSRYGLALLAGGTF
jgi:hypothetical protein